MLQMLSSAPAFHAAQRCIKRVQRVALAALSLCRRFRSTLSALHTHNRNHYVGTLKCALQLSNSVQDDDRSVSWRRYEKRHSNTPAHISPCFRAKEGDNVIIGQCRPLSKTVCGLLQTVLDDLPAQTTVCVHIYRGLQAFGQRRYANICPLLVCSIRAVHT